MVASFVGAALQSVTDDATRGTAASRADHAAARTRFEPEQAKPVCVASLREIVPASHVIEKNLTTRNKPRPIIKTLFRSSVPLKS